MTPIQMDSAGCEATTTKAANLLYEATVLVARTAIPHNIAITENPANSLMWKTSSFVLLFSDFPELKFVTFYNCAHGGTRDKLTCFATTGLIHFHFGATGNTLMLHGRQL